MEQLEGGFEVDLEIAPVVRASGRTLDVEQGAPENILNMKADNIIAERRTARQFLQFRSTWHPLR
jgi:hypothetical protein